MKMKYKRNKKVFIMDTWAYPYRIPIFEQLDKRFDVELFFSRPIPRTHKSKVSLDYFGKCVKSGKLLFAYMPVHLLWSKHDVYLVGQIGIQSTPGVFLTLLVAKFHGKPLVLWTDYIETPYYLKTKPVKRFLGGIVRKIVINQCTTVMGFGKYTAQYLKKITHNKLKVFQTKQVIPEVCNTPISESEKNSMDDTDKCILLCVSYFDQGKGIDFLIEIFKRMQMSNAVLVLAGAGKDEARLKKIAADSDNIEFCGYVAGKEKALRFASADIFVFTSFHDTWGLVINEAMYYGLPIITTDSVGGYELISDNGIVIPAGDSKALEQAMHELINNAILRKEMGVKSKAYISKYGLDYGVDAFTQLIEYAVQHTRTSRK